MVGEKLLSETACRGAKPTEKVYYLNDGVGFPPRRSFVDTVMGYEETLKQRDEVRQEQPPLITH